jgi:hypothetical protein
MFSGRQSLIAAAALCLIIAASFVAPRHGAARAVGVSEPNLLEVGGELKTASDRVEPESL